MTAADLERGSPSRVHLHGIAAVLLVLVSFLSPPKASAGRLLLHPSAPPPALQALHVQGKTLFDTDGQAVLLRGAQIPGLNVIRPNSDERAAIAHLTPPTFKVMHQDWRMNALRLPLSDVLWQQDPSGYLRTVLRVIGDANAAGLFVILDLHEDNRSGVPVHAGRHLPTALAVSFWHAVASQVLGRSGVIFDVFNEPTVNVPQPPTTKGQTKGPKPLHGLSPADWDLWLHGGPIDGSTFVGMQHLVDTIRETGARQVVVVEGLRGGQSFIGIEGHFIQDANVMYSVHPYFTNYWTQADWDANFGFLAERYPVYAGEWGLIPNGYRSGGCAHIPTAQAMAKVTELLTYFGQNRISWTAFAFMVPKLIQNYKTDAPTTFSGVWRCGDSQNRAVGMGKVVKDYLTVTASVSGLTY